ncbi:hypothetical protein A6R68_01578 [Neotoma lepida]|uniref:Uncharacterized protein n=1 Tax=Neotoma lepida TaxID=56216 RepID=A0A1A6GX08_NEOLE|nr:hypothetical protein A6R68_01578 [Neotoma lepida]
MRQWLQAKVSKNTQEVKIDFENFLHKLRVEAKLEEYKGSRALSPKLPQSPQSPQSSSPSSTAMSEDSNYVEEG